MKSKKLTNQSYVPTITTLFEKDLCDDNDPEVDDIGDILGLCSGKFATQKPVPQDTGTIYYLIDFISL